MGTPDRGHGRRVDYRLADAADLAGGAARAFVVPTRRPREPVRPGDLVEVLCEVVDPAEGMPRLERVWVHVTRSSGPAITGVVDNEPRVITTLGPGDEISFGPEHVVATHDTASARTVVVSRRAHVEDIRPRFVYRQPPMSPSDSGFSVMVGDESRAELDDPGALMSHATGYLLDRWPELRPVFATRVVEGEWVWDESTGSYVPRETPTSG